MEKFLISFGQEHTHSLNGVTIDKDILVEVNAKNHYEASKKAHKLFGNLYCTTYMKNTKDENFYEYFPRGIYKSSI